MFAVDDKASVDEIESVGEVSRKSSSQLKVIAINATNNNDLYLFNNISNFLEIKFCS
jgi:hypothetical protein